VTERPLRMGTRASALARAQSAAAASELTKATGIGIETVIVRTEGDQLSSEGKAPSGGDEAGVFVRALDDALRRGEVDFAVHSLKDVPTAAAEGLSLAAVPRRADARDALVVASRHPGVASLGSLPRGAVLGTSSPRRVAQILRIRRDLATVAISGNVDTRLRRLEEGRADALLLASAGLDRLGRSAVITCRLDPAEILPAPAQGALAMVCREGDLRVLEALATQDDFASRAAAEAERAVLQGLRGGCRAPVGAHAVFEDNRLCVRARVLSLDGRKAVEGSEEKACATVADAVALGHRLAERLLGQGAGRLVDSARAAGL